MSIKETIAVHELQQRLAVLPREHWRGYDENPQFKTTLDDLAWRINTQWKQSDDRRLSAALGLKEAKVRIEAGEDRNFTSFWQWCAAKLVPKRSEGDIRRLLAFAESDDPEEELRQHRAKTAEQTRQYRARKAAAAAATSDGASTRSTAAAGGPGSRERKN